MAPLEEPLADLLTTLAGPRPPAFAVLHRPQAHPGACEVLLGEVSIPATVGDLPLEPGGPDVLAVLPFRQLVERGMDVVDDGSPLLALRVTGRRLVASRDLLDLVPDGPHGFVETGYDVPDAEYERIVAAVLDDEIAGGEGSNVVVHRSLTGHVPGPPAAAGLGAFARLLRRERHAYWTFLVHVPGTPEREGITFVGASPERHVSVHGGVVTMNPISGTLRYPAGGYPSADAALDGTLRFLADAKERDELAMVVDEELKMMAAVCPAGGRVHGPHLKEMAHLAHTEYVLSGHTALDVRDVLRETMFAPTVTGSPIRNACRMIARHEGRGRGYYGGALALLSHGAAGQSLDAPILIRTATIADDGRVAIASGATLVRGSRPASELAETRAKAAAVVAAFTTAEPESVPSARHHPVANHPQVVSALAGRNERLADFWLQEQGSGGGRRPAGGVPVTILHAEDDFTAMLAHLLRSLGHPVRVVEHTEPGARETCRDAELLVLGPGPGDPRHFAVPRIRALHVAAGDRLASGAPVLGVCLGHQVLSLRLGLAVERLPAPDQGVQRRIRLFGHDTRVGFYNSYAAFARESHPGAVPGVELAADGRTGRVHALRGKSFAGLQFHLESVLTTDGPRILTDTLAHLLR
ncbi:anthranilate synthase family protein [Spongisporangium articulatum]|uniref:anthranilate synthase n=1 Tax=Spongisporangium articulatum TaxID=3362603 RepID=A0ABW8AQ11_9ACTN